MRAMYTPRAAAIPSFNRCARPRRSLPPRTRMRRSASHATCSGHPSVEPSFTRRSSQSARVCCSKEHTAKRRAEPPLWTGSSTLTRGELFPPCERVRSPKDGKEASCQGALAPTRTGDIPSACSIHQRWRDVVRCCNRTMPIDRTYRGPALLRPALRAACPRAPDEPTNIHGRHLRKTILQTWPLAPSIKKAKLPIRRLDADGRFQVPTRIHRVRLPDAPHEKRRRAD